MLNFPCFSPHKGPKSLQTFIGIQKLVNTYEYIAVYTNNNLKHPLIEGKNQDKQNR